MSSVRQEGKDRIIFVTKEDHDAPSSAELVEEDPNDPYEERGLILPSGEINWNCPCLGGMASGPCGTEFKEAFSCFHYSKEEVKGSECLEQFRAMQECMQRYPELYPQEDDKAQQEQSSETDQTLKDSASEETSNSTAASEQDSDTTQPNTEGSGKS
ncbi:coiled-coil-helix-coiled-coil-helix domain containing 4b [Sparus aurata]|uniref:Coiled-coil-helix-coiled-coil-helix domain containing 4 n=1 Tax=Sparus aurata TaxID=8175 RepID=A0A671VYK5_SPAAU|nr:mitochondrial intermembrane space import and assembly protein 40-B-like [Sparus aurata]